jgi:hypothetical protein
VVLGTTPVVADVDATVVVATVVEVTLVVDEASADDGRSALTSAMRPPVTYA